MDWREKALTGILLILLILSLTFGPIWSMAFPILLGMIASAVTRAVEMMKTKPILPVSDPAPAVDAPVDAPAPAVDALALSVDAPVDAPALSVDAPVDAPVLAVDALALSVDAPVDASALAPAVVAAGIRRRRKPTRKSKDGTQGFTRFDHNVIYVHGRGKKMVVKLDLSTNRDRATAMKVVSGFGGVRSLNMDTKDNKLTVCGDFDPVKVVNKLKKSWRTQVVSVGPATKDDGNRNENPIVQAYQEYYPLPLTFYEEENPNC